VAPTDTAYTDPHGPSRHRPPLHHHAHSAVSRHLLLGWLVWLLISLTVNLAIDSPLSVWTNDTLRPAVRGLTQSIVIGLVLVWPVWRLSQRRDPQPGYQTATDLFVLLLTAQIPLAGMMVWAAWPPRHLLLVDLIVVTYTCASAVLLWLGWRHGGFLARAAAAMGCGALLLAGWAAFALGASPELALWSPNSLLWALAHPLTELPAEQVLWRAAVVGGAAGALWLAGLGLAGRGGAAVNRL
jgi:hypothetical protein